MKKKGGRKIILAVVAAALVLTAVMGFIMPRITSKKAAGPDTGTMENVNPTEYIAEPVDLGLSVKWASFNVGASKPEEYGGLYGWGDAWRLPTKEEQDELVEKCDWKKGSYHGVKGYTVTGPNGNTIFLPGVGGRIEDKTYYQVDGADYWSGTLGSNTDTAYYLYYYIGEEPAVGTLPRHYGFAVRAVCD